MKDNMKIGIVIYSHTGHTLSVATELKDKLSASGHAATLEQVEPVEKVSPSATRAELKTAPTVAPYDALVLGCPVWGGRMSAPMTSYLEQIDSLQGKQVVCLVTHFFRRAWGAKQTIESMTEICESKGATVRGSGSVKWLSLNRKRQISQAVDELSGLF